MAFKGLVTFFPSHNVKY